jgi:hypothetical protein
MMIGTFTCRLCLDHDGVETASVVEHRCTDERTGKHFTTNVCARCLEAGRETRVTCRTFVSRVDRPSLLSNLIGVAVGASGFMDPEVSVRAAIDAHRSNVGPIMTRYVAISIKTRWATGLPVSPFPTSRRLY